MRINTEEIMAEIKKEAAGRKYPDKVLQFADIDIPKAAPESIYDNERFQNEVRQMNASYAVSYDYPIQGSALGRFLRKVGRKLSRWLTSTLVAEQNRFNGSVVRAMNEVVKLDAPGTLDDLSGRTEENEEFLSKLDDRYSGYFDHHEQIEEQMRTRILELEQRVDQLEKKLSAAAAPEGKQP